MRKTQSWLGKSGAGRKSFTLPMTEQTKARRLRKAVGLANHDKHRSTDKYGTVAYPTPSAAQMERAGMAV